jgi:HK97 family phage portal protein
MNFLTKIGSLLGRKSVAMADASFYETMRRLGFGVASKSGADVNTETALQVSTVMACVRVIAEGGAQVPFKLYRANNGRREAATAHPLYDILHSKPNEWMTSFTLRETFLIHAVLTGTGFIYINRASSGKILELIPLLPGSVTVKQAPDWSLRYEIRGQVSGDTKTLLPEQIWRLPGPSWNGVVGMDMTRYAREAIGLAMATEETQANMQKNGLNVTGLYSVDGTLNETQQKNLTKWLVDEKAGLTEGGVMVLDRNAKYTPIGQKGVDAQQLETRNHQVQEICRMFRVMPIMAGYSDKAATYASAEAMFQAHVIYTLAAWYERVEQSANCQLLTSAERAHGYYTKHTVAGLLRGSLKDRADYFAKALGSGGSPAWMTQDEVRELEEMNPMGGTAAVLPLPTNVSTSNKPSA